MYKNVYYDRNNNEVIVWDDKKGRLNFKYKKYAYIKAPNGRYTALDGNRVEKVYSWDKEDEQRGIIYESDIKPEVRILIDNYGDTDDIAENISVMFFDIEVSKGDGYSSPWDADNEVTAITLYDNISKDWNVLLLDKDRLTKNKKTDKYIFEAFSTERDLLTRFYQLYLEISPDILTGWNIDGFDVPYIFHRTKKILGANIAKQLSPVGVVHKDFRKDRLVIGGVSALDYMYLYRAFTYNEEPSYALEFISQKELGRGKVKFDGDLDNLYKTDLEKFIEYNINDVQLVVDLDEKLDFITLARNICHKGHVPYEDVFASTRYLDGACLTYLNRLGVISTNKPVRESHDDDDDNEEADGFDGAYVKDPKPGLYEWVFDLDLKALYPSTQRTLNISPETKVCKIENWDHQKFMMDDPDYVYKYKSKSWKGLEFRKFLEENQFSVSAIGVIYDLTRKGLVPSILEKWDAERTEYRQLAKKYGESGDEKMYRFFDSRQLTMKILSNSLYGVLGNAGFRFFDIDNAEGTTLSGKAVVIHKTDYINGVLNEKLRTAGIDYVLYIDTDSVGKDSIITTEKYGDITVEDLYNKESKINGSVTDISGRKFVFPNSCDSLYYDENSQHVKPGKIQYIEKHKVKKRMFLITDSAGNKVKVTEDHSIMVLDTITNKLIEKKPTDLKKGDKIISIVR